jgi:hypothetical protein
VPSGTIEPNRHPLVKDWPNVATRDSDTIAAWAAQFAFNKPAVAIVAGDGKTWAIDCDEPEWLGKSLPRTSAVRSGGGGLHLYFRHDAYSRRVLVPLGNTYVKGAKRDKAVELFVGPPHPFLAPGTIHQKTGNRYEWIHEMKPKAASRKFVDMVAELPWSRSGNGPQTTSDREPGLWSPAALEACLAEYGVEYETGRYEGQYRVACPGNAEGWADGSLHTKPSDKLTDKTVVGLVNGWPWFKCLSTACEGKRFPDFRLRHDPLRLLFSIDSWIETEATRIRKEFRRGQS